MKRSSDGGKDVLARALAKTDSVQSLQIASTEISDLGEITQRTNLEIIQVEDDYYARRTQELRIGAEWRPQPARAFEQLILQGRQYKRELATGLWEPDEPSDGAFVINVGASHRDRVSPRTRRIQHGFDFSSVLNISRVADQNLAGERVAHLVGTTERPPFGERGGQLDRLKLDASRFSPDVADLPDRILGDTHITGSVEVWMGIEDMILRKFVRFERYIRDGQVVKTVQTAVRLSGFNESQLPGPLPEE